MLLKPAESQPTLSTSSTTLRPEGRLLLLLPDKVFYPLHPQLPDVLGLGPYQNPPDVMDETYREMPPGPDPRPDLAAEGKAPNGK